MNKFELNKYVTDTLLAPDLAMLACNYGKMDARRHPPVEEEYPDSKTCL